MAVVLVSTLCLALAGLPDAAGATQVVTGHPTIAAPIGVHVVHPAAGSPYLADANGQMLLLRGVDDNALVRYPSDHREAPPVSQADFAEMAALGFNFIRLPVSWSRIMPRPGVINHGYLDRVARIVSWARIHGIGVLVDMHQDNYSAVTDPTAEADGAPAWAVDDNGTPCTPVISTTACALAAFSNFWANATVSGRPLQSWYLEAATAVAQAAGATSPSSNVVGVELMNEPWPSGPSPFEQKSLYPFYQRMISGLRQGGVVVPLWFEPSIVRDITDNAVSVAARFSNDPNLVYAVHIYSGVFAPPYGPSVSLSAMATSYANAAKEAAIFGTPYMVDEFGSSSTPAWNGWLGAQLTQQNNYVVGSGFWLWKQRKGSWANWAVVHLNGSLRSSSLRAQQLSQPHVDSVPGELMSTSASAENLTATVDGPGGKAVFWGGTEVRKGGTSTTLATLRHVAVDGHPVAAHCQMVRYDTRVAELSGCRLTVRIPAGLQVVVVSPGTR
ncbi:MAG: glycoside hydrolase family 5 protein [Acidimicrobiales bacterium]